MSAFDQQQDDTELQLELRHSMSLIKSFRHNEMTLRARGGFTLIQDVVYAVSNLIRFWDMLTEQDRHAMSQSMSENVVEAVKVLCCATFRTTGAANFSQLDCVKQAAECASSMLRIGLVDCSLNFFLYLYPMHDGKVHDQLQFFHNSETLPVDEQKQLINVTVWDGVFVPMAVLSYMDILLAHGLLDDLIREIDRVHISSSRSQGLINFLLRLRHILPHFALSRVRECLLRALNGVLTSDGHDLRKLDKNVLEMTFRSLIHFEMQLKVVSVDELGFIGISLLKSPLLDKRMVGSNCLHMLCEHAVIARAEYDKGDAICISLRHFLMSHGALDLLFGPSMHSEVSKFKRCSNIIRVLFLDRSDDSRTLELAAFLWKSLFDRHSEMFECCFQAYQFALQCVSEHVLRNCLREVLSTTDEIMNTRPQILNLLSVFLDLSDRDAAINKDFVVSISEYLLTLQLVHCDDPGFSELGMLSKSILFAPALQDANVPVLFKRICHRCVDVLQNRSSTSCKILEFLLEFYSERHAESCECELVNILCHALDALCSRSVLDACSVSIFAFLSHHAVVKLIGQEQEEKLWHALAVDSADEGRRQQAFEFILQSQSLCIDVQQSILETRLPRLSALYMSPKALECLLYLIKAVNSPEHQSRVGEKRNRPELLDFTSSSSVIGLDTLWNFCLSCPDANILQHAVSKFSGYIIDSGLLHPGIFKSVVDSCVLVLRSVGTDFVKARNAISLMLDFSRSINQLLKGDFADPRHQPLGCVVAQPNVYVMVISDCVTHNMYCSSLMTIKQFKNEIGSKFKSLVSYSIFFQVVNCEGQLEFVKINSDFDYLGRYGPSITCKLIPFTSEDRSSRVKYPSSVRRCNSFKSEKQQNLMQPESKMPRVHPPLALCEVVPSSVSSPSIPCLPVVYVPCDDHTTVLDSDNVSNSTLCEVSSPTHKTRERFDLPDSDLSHASKSLEGSSFDMWSIFIENSGNYQVLFELGSTFPQLNARIWELLLLLPVNVDFISRIRHSLSQSQLFVDLHSTLEKMYFLSCVSVWKKLPSYCCDQHVGSDDFYSSVAVAALDTADSLRCSVCVALSNPDPTDAFQDSFSSLFLSSHLCAIFTIRLETHSETNFTCLSYYLALLPAGIIGMSPCDVSDPLDKLTESIFKNFERRAMQGYPNSHSAALASSAVSIIQMLLSMNISAFLKSFLEIPSSRRQAIVRLLLCSCSCSNLQYGPNEFSLHLQLLLLELLSAMASSFLQCDVLNEIVDFVQQDSYMLSSNVSLHWFDPFLKNRRFVRDGCTTSESLIRATSRILRSICKFMGIAKRNEDVRCFKLPSLFVLQSFILQLMSPMDISSHPLARECSESFRAIFDVAAFPQEVTLSDASDDLKLNVLSPRPLTLLLKRPLFAQEDDACLEFSQLVHEAAFRFPGFCSAVFETLLHHSESMLTFEEKLPSGYSSNIGSYHGILNLGCTCYFNSITQQLFMLPGFAATVIAAQVKADAPQDSEVVEESKVDVSKSAISTPNTIACGVLEKFKELMISLRHGSGPVVHPKNFCDSFRFPDGSCILPDVQQDALEYFHILCDHLDNALKGGNDEKLLSRFFGGRSATQLICRGCPHRYERFEHFFTLQLAVFSNRSNSVMGALQDFVAGELLEGDNQYFCSQCNKKVDTVKRTVLADLPDSIILGLKRFDFNYDTMQRIKLNVDVPFSEDLDMSAFCRENLSEIPQNSEPVTKRDAGYYQYSLAGIVVHSGMADSGHYFSIIRDPKQAGLWHKFNDDIVTPIQNFDLKQFFGGHFSGKHVHTNAYILVYNRKVAIFNHQYNQITSLENAVEAVQETEKLSTQTMFLDTLRNKHLWNCFTLSMQKLFASSDDGRMETAYIDLILKVNTCSDLDSVESVESFLQPLEGSLRNAKKCNSILESCFARFDDGPTVDSVLFQPVVDACSKRLHQLPLLFTHIMAQITSAVNGSDMLLFNSDEKVIQLGIVCKILNFYGNLSTRLFRLFPHENHLDIEPLTPPVALAVQYCLHQALEHGLTRICFQYLCLSAQQSNESAELFLLRTCLTAANYSHLCEDGTKLRSKRRAYLRAFVRDCRFLSCWNCLKLLKICFVDQSFVPLQDFLDHGAWSECFTTLFAPDFMIRFIYSDPVPIPLHLNILVMFYEVTQKMLPLMPALVNCMLENLHHLAAHSSSFCLDPQMLFAPKHLATLVCNVFRCLGGNPWKLLSELYASVITGYAENRHKEDEEAPHHTYRMMIVILCVDAMLRQLPGEESQTLANYMASMPSQRLNQHRRLLSDLKSRPNPPCYDDGEMYCSSPDSVLSTQYFLLVVNLLQAASGATAADVPMPET